MNISRVTAVAALVVAGAVAVPVGAYAHGAKGGPDAVGLAREGTALVRFDTDRPDRARKPVALKGLQGDDALVGIDRRVQNGKLYGVGDEGGLYTLARTTGRATKVGQLSVRLEGTRFGVDFNPAANALRVVSDTGQNLRQPFGTGDGPSAATVDDGTLNYTGVTAPGVTGAAYTNNDLAADTATTLFVLDTTLDQVVIQSPANSGSLAATGKLGLDAGPAAGLDIHTTLKRGTSVGSTAYAVLSVGGQQRLSSVDLLTGDAVDRGALRSGVIDLAVDLSR